MSSENQNLLGAVNVTSFWHEKPGSELVFQVVSGQADLIT